MVHSKTIYDTKRNITHLAHMTCVSPHIPAVAQVTAQTPPVRDPLRFVLKSLIEAKIVINNNSRTFVPWGISTFMSSSCSCRAAVVEGVAVVVLGVAAVVASAAVVVAGVAAVVASVAAVVVSVAAVVASAAVVVAGVAAVVVSVAAVVASVAAVVASVAEVVTSVAAVVLGVATRRHLLLG
ncbi:hypothetical protein Pmani_013335 [Petrolisthes manimaculis]|uniref:Uncharacterized protein n=1 Tax=Petrolisthes manimaculis TaxID=1843537 RepID=A0AAE1PVV5_9EUCA|nr:hypothetical protein Pmani_013335 [Petrolisthes manimaculis]